MAASMNCAFKAECETCGKLKLGSDYQANSAAIDHSRANPEHVVTVERVWVVKG